MKCRLEAVPGQACEEVHSWDGPLSGYGSMTHTCLAQHLSDEQ